MATGRDGSWRLSRREPRRTRYYMDPYGIPEGDVQRLVDMLGLTFDREGIEHRVREIIRHNTPSPDKALGRRWYLAVLVSGDPGGPHVPQVVTSEPEDSVALSLWDPSREIGVEDMADRLRFWAGRPGPDLTNIT